MKKKFKDLLILLIVLILGVTYILPAILQQKEVEWQEAGMPSILETLDADQNQDK